MRTRVAALLIPALLLRAQGAPSRGTPPVAPPVRIGVERRRIRWRRRRSFPPSFLG